MNYDRLLQLGGIDREVPPIPGYISKEELQREIYGINTLIPEEASDENQLADKQYVNDTVATNSAAFRGSYNLVSDLNLTTSATKSDIATALASAVSDAENAQTVYVQIPIADDAPTQIDHEERYKYNGTSWEYEYSPNVSVTDGVFDISAYNNNTKYADLASALGSNGANVPQSVRKGGMSVKFVQSSDNKYIQARCMAQDFTTDVTQWQRVDDEIKDNDNLVTGKGIKAGTLEEKEHLITEQNVVGYLTDKNKSIIAKLMKNGAVEWIVKNSRDIFVDDKISEIEESIQGVSGNLRTQTERVDELDENAIREVSIEGSEDSIAAYITDKKKQIIGTINYKAEVEFYAGGGFAGEKTTDANIGEYIKLITSKNGVIIGGIKPNGTVHIFNAKIDNLDNDNINVIA